VNTLISAGPHRNRSPAPARLDQREEGRNRCRISGEAVRWNGGYGPVRGPTNSAASALSAVRRGLVHHGASSVDGGLIRNFSNLSICNLQSCIFHLQLFICLSREKNFCWECPPTAWLARARHEDGVRPPVGLKRSCRVSDLKTRCCRCGAADPWRRHDSHEPGRTS